MMAITPDMIERWFTYHPPRAGQRERYEALRNTARQLAKQIYELTPPGEDQAEALRRLRDVVMTANAAITCEGPTQSAYFERKIVRKRVGSRGAEDEGFTKEPDEFEVTELDEKLALYRPSDDDDPVDDPDDVDDEQSGAEK